MILRYEYVRCTSHHRYREDHIHTTQKDKKTTRRRKILIQVKNSQIEIGRERKKALEQSRQECKKS